MYALTVPTPDRHGSDHERDLAYEWGRRVAAERVRLAMTQADLAHELAVDTRTVKKFEAGESSALTFEGPAGQSAVARMEHGEAVWSGRGVNRRFVGPGLVLNSRLERIFKMPEGGLIYGLWVPEPEKTVGSLADHIKVSREISEPMRKALLGVLENSGL